MTAILAMLAVAPQSATFFPLEAGQTWEYLVSVTNSVVRVRQIQKTLPVQQYEGAACTPLEIYLDGKIDATGYYRVVDGYVCLVGVSGPTRLPDPIKLLPVDPKRGQKWAFEGRSMMMGMVLPSKTESRVTEDKEGEVFGKKVRMITIETKSTIGEGDQAFTSESTDVYAAGIGLVTRRQESWPGRDSKRSSVALTTLIRHEKAGGS